MSFIEGPPTFAVEVRDGEEDAATPLLLDEPDLIVPALLAALPPPGPGDPH